MFLRYITNPTFPRGIKELGSHQSTVLKTMLALTRSTVELTNQCIFSFSQQSKYLQEDYRQAGMLTNSPQCSVMQNAEHHVFIATKM
jgi:hypothetical protein